MRYFYLLECSPVNPLEAFCKKIDLPLVPVRIMGNLPTTQRRDALSGGRGRAILNCSPGVAELADALDSKSSGT